MDEVTILTPEWLLDDPPSPPRRGMAVIIRGSVIDAVVPASTAQNAIPLPGVTLLPGLIDAHVHLTLCGCHTPRQTMMQESNDLLLRFFRPLYLTRRNVVRGIEPSCRGATLHESSSPLSSY